MGFDGKRILVTGRSRGIGRAAVIEFVSQGARVAVNGRTGGFDRRRHRSH
jgi:3-oxoacyl-[acyl-carrier protein] reductase